MAVPRTSFTDPNRLQFMPSIAPGSSPVIPVSSNLIPTTSMAPPPPPPPPQGKATMALNPLQSMGSIANPFAVGTGTLTTQPFGSFAALPQQDAATLPASTIALAPAMLPPPAHCASSTVFAAPLGPAPTATVPLGSVALSTPPTPVATASVVPAVVQPIQSMASMSLPVGPMSSTFLPVARTQPVVTILPPAATVAQRVATVPVARPATTLVTEPPLIAPPVYVDNAKDLDYQDNGYPDIAEPYRMNYAEPVLEDVPEEYQDFYMLTGDPPVRIEPHWMGGQWYLTVPCDFKGMEKYPTRRQQIAFEKVDNAIREADMQGEIPALPPKCPWKEDGQHCPIA